jgi:flagellar biosynthesis regulator FlaF
MINDSTYYVRKNLIEPVKTVDNNLTQSSMRILDCYFSLYIESEIKKISKEEIANLETMIP